jgi:hypothetical protein
MSRMTGGPASNWARVQVRGPGDGGGATDANATGAATGGGRMRPSVLGVRLDGARSIDTVILEQQPSAWTCAVVLPRDSSSPPQHGDNMVVAIALQRYRTRAEGTNVTATITPRTMACSAVRLRSVAIKQPVLSWVSRRIVYYYDQLLGVQVSVKAPHSPRALAHTRWCRRVPPIQIYRRIEDVAGSRPRVVSVRLFRKLDKSAGQQQQGSPVGPGRNGEIRMSLDREAARWRHAGPPLEPRRERALR